MSDVAELMKRCQRGVGGRNALDEAHDIMAECYGTLGRLEAERDTLRQQRDKLAGLLRDARELIDHGDFREGHCMCGSSVDDHGVGDGHSPVDAGEYYAGQLIDRIKTALSEPTP